MFQLLRGFVAALREEAAALDASQLSGEVAADLVRLCDEAERGLAALRMVLAARVEESRVWRRAGFRTAAEWLASETRVSVGHAVETLETARRLEALPSTREAFAAGELSAVQAREITKAASVDPASEQMLLAVARKESVAGLRERCAEVRAAAARRNEEENYRRLHAERSCRWWTDPEGAVRLEARLTPDDGARVIATLARTRDRLERDARRGGRRERLEGHAADALVEHVVGERRGPAAMVHVVVDHETYTRGTRDGGSGGIARIEEVGPVPASVALDLARDSIIRILETDGVDVRRVAHAGRTIPAHVRTALEHRDRVCVVPRCDQRRRLQIDHIDSVCAGGWTKLDNLARLCPFHHYLKTHEGYRLGGGPGEWRWTPPRTRVEVAPPLIPGRAPPALVDA